MSDSHSSDARHMAREADRESRAEALLVEGLDQYLAGHYEDAIHVWTRVLFIDRGHQRARAYIERARSALSERQRRADEMLHRTEALVDAGSLEQARSLLSEVAQTSADDARVASLWTDIDRAERALREPPAATATAPGERRSKAAPVLPARRSSAVLGWVLVAAVGVLAVTALRSPTVRGWFGAAEPVSTPAAGPPPRFDVPTSAEVALTRARTLYARGRLAEALAVLERVSPSSPERAAIDAFRVEIQSVLLSTVPATSSPAGSPP